MSLEEKVGQLFLIGFQGQDLSQGLEKTIEEIKPGGILVFKKNIKSPDAIAELNRKAQLASFKSSRTPLFVAIDQEGGRVTRIQTQPGQPSPQAIGITKDQTLAQDLALEIGTILRSLGFNMNLAPVLDVSPEGKKTFIGTRSFGGNVEVVSALSSAFSKGLMNANVMPTAKHFPGTGAVENDPHLSVVKKSMDRESLLNHHVKPYRSFAKLSTNTAIMISHVVYPEIDNSGLPATFSKSIMQDLLRRDLGFQGLIVTDDLLMAGAKVYKTSGESAEAAFNAGADLLMFAWSRKEQKVAHAYLIEAVKTGKITEERLNESVFRIMQAKSAYFHRDDVIPKKINVAAITNSKELRRINNRILNLRKSQLKKTRLPAPIPRAVSTNS